MLTETATKVSTTVETAVGGYLRKTFLGLFNQLVGSTFQTQQLHVTGHIIMFAAFRENGSHTLFRQLEAVHNGLTPEPGVEKQFFAHNHLIDLLEELFLAGGIEIGDCRRGRGLGLLLIPVLLLVVHCFGNLLDQDTVLAADGPVMEDNNDGKDCYSEQNGYHTNKDIALAGVFCLLLHDSLLLLLLMIDSSQLLSRVPGLTAPERVLYFQHLLVEVGGLLATTHLPTGLGQAPFGGIHHLTQSVALFAYALNQVIVDGNSLLILITVTGSLTDSKIGVSMEKAGAFTSGFGANNDKAPVTYFLSDNNDYTVVLKDNSEAELKRKMEDGIQSVPTDNGQLTMDHYWYDLNGRQLQGKPTRKGVYIVGGKMVVIK